MHTVNNSLAEHFNMFVDKRIHQVKLSLENDVLYQEQQSILDSIDDIPDSALDMYSLLQLIAEEHAYKQGFIDGLTLMAGCSA